MKTWLIEKNVMKHHYLKKKNFTVTKEDIITDTDFENAKRFCKDFEIKKLGEQHDLYVQSDTLLLADVCENVQNMCLKIYELDPACLILAPGLVWQTALKK